MIPLIEIVHLTQGMNTSRISSDVDKLYDQKSFEIDDMSATMPNELLFDKENADLYVKPGDVVINNMNQRAAIVSSENQGKLLTGNFFKVDFLNYTIDKSYFVYLYNENREVLKEKNKQLQGTTVVQKLTKSGLNSLLLPMVSFEKQQEIGQIYLKLQQLKKKMHQQIDNLDQFTIQILEGKINSENK